MRLRPPAIPSTTAPRCHASASSAAPISSMTPDCAKVSGPCPTRHVAATPGAGGGPGGTRHGPFGKIKNATLNLMPWPGRAPEYGRALLEVAHGGQVRAGPGGGRAGLRAGDGKG